MLDDVQGRFGAYSRFERCPLGLELLPALDHFNFRLGAMVEFSLSFR